MSCPNRSIAPVDIAPAPGHLDIGLIHLPAAADRVLAGSGCLGQQRREAQHSAVDRHMVHLDTPLGEELLDVAIGQSEAQTPANRQHDHIGREAEACEGGARRDRRVGAVSGSMPEVSPLRRPLR
jgi:hypothetical protein